MAADFDRIKDRVTELLNACAAGAFTSTLSTRNKTRNESAIEAACYEGGLKVLRKLASIPNEFRANLISTVSLTHAQLLPEHHGKPAFVEIQKYSGATWTQGEWRDYHKIDSYRIDGARPANARLYDSIAHNEQNSTLSGFYDIWEKKFYFSGYAARAGLATASRADVLTKIPDFLESTVIKFGLAGCPKAGEGAITLAIADRYERAAEKDLLDFEGGKRQMPEVPEPEAALPVQP